ncbi:GNAT family N-acetyltransferase [Candidatus Saccharibacteria bacterium]|nr:GNAT family N-acetyltransferase [Candidatus Saccharibacteria bacterium]
MAIKVEEVPRDASQATILLCSRLLTDFADWHVLQCEPWQAPPARPRDEAYVREVLADPEQWLLLAFLEDKAVGIIHLSVHHTRDKPGWPDHDYGYIEAEWVRPVKRRQGVGKAMVEATKKHFRTLGIDSIETNVWGWNTKSRALHEARGAQIKNINYVIWLEPDTRL